MGCPIPSAKQTPVRPEPMSAFDGKATWRLARDARPYRSWASLRARSPDVAPVFLRHIAVDFEGRGAEPQYSLNDFLFNRENVMCCLHDVAAKAGVQASRSADFQGWRRPARRCHRSRRRLRGRAALSVFGSVAGQRRRIVQLRLSRDPLDNSGSESHRSELASAPAIPRS